MVGCKTSLIQTYQGFQTHLIQFHHCGIDLRLEAETANPATPKEPAETETVSE
jgi:hypothetical protein